MQLLRCRSDACRPLRNPSAILRWVLHECGVNGALLIRRGTSRSKGYGALLTDIVCWSSELLGIFRRITGGSGGYPRGFAFNSSARLPRTFCVETGWSD